MTPAYSQLRQFPSRKDEVAKFTDKLIHELRSGDVNPLEFKTALKAIENIIEQVKEVLDPMALAEAEKYNNKEFTDYGCRITVKELGVKYDFSTTNDPVIGGLLADKLALDAKIKERSTFLKTIKEPMNISSEATGGEEVTIYPPVKKSTTGLAIQLV